MVQLLETPAQFSTATVHFYREQEYNLPKEERHAFIKGKIIRMGGASLNHTPIFTNFFLALGLRLQEKNYLLYPSDMRVNIPVSGSYFFPDITVVRGEPQLKDRAFDNLLDPCLIIEIISTGTEEYDRIDKFIAYQSILTLEEYVLVSSDKLQIEYFRRESPNQWQKRLFNKAEDPLNLLNGELSIVIADIYRNIKF